VAWWFASSSFLADSANLGCAISLVMLASVTLGNSFFNFFLVMVQLGIKRRAIQSGLEHNLACEKYRYGTVAVCHIHSPVLTPLVSV
jgi:hypothetical protein